MQMLIMYLKVFAVGGLLCVIGQLLLNYTKLTTARILVIFLVAGVVLQAVGVYQYLVDFAGAGATIPIIGFGYTLAKGAMEGAKLGFLEAVTGGVKHAAMGLSAVIFFGYINALICKSKTKK